MEMLVAAALFALAIGTIIGIFPLSAKATRQSQAALVAATVAQDEMELVRAMSYEGVPPLRERKIEVEVVFAGRVVLLSYEVTSVAVVKEPGLKGVTVTVVWNEPDGKTRREVLNTDVARLSP